MKILSTLLSLILLLSSMNLTVIRHYCGGRVAEVKLAILGEASCGMEKNQGTCSSNPQCTSEGISKKNCCEDKLTQISSTDNYKPALGNRLTDLQHLFIAFHSISVFFYEQESATLVRNYKAPPNIRSVSLSFIQVFIV